MPSKQSTFDFDQPEEQPKPDVPLVAEAKLHKPGVPEVIDLDTAFIAAEPDEAQPKKSTRGRMKISDMNLTLHLVDVPEDEILFQKRYYSIGAVSAMFKVNASLIRFWENEFTILKPKKNGKGDRFFRPEDVKNLQLIHHLLRERKYTIEGAKEFLKNNKKTDEKFSMIESLKKLKFFLQELKTNL